MNHNCNELVEPNKRASNSSSCCNSTASSTCSVVHFDAVEIIELPYSLGDNPSVSQGAPISTEWFAQQRTILNFEAYELHRSPTRRSGGDLVVSKAAREQLLLRHGFSQGEIADAALEASRTKDQRKQNKPQHHSHSPNSQRMKKGSSRSSGRYSPPPPSSSPTSSPDTLPHKVLSPTSTTRTTKLQVCPPPSPHRRDTRWDSSSTCTSDSTKAGGLCLPRHDSRRGGDLSTLHHLDAPSPPSRNRRGKKVCSKSLSPVRVRTNEKQLDRNILQLGSRLML